MCVIGSRKPVDSYSKNSLPLNFAAASNDIANFPVIQSIPLFLLHNC